MGLFSKRRSKGFDPDLWSDAKDRAKAKTDEPWFAGLDEAGDDPALDECLQVAQDDRSFAAFIARATSFAGSTSPTSRA